MLPHLQRAGRAVVHTRAAVKKSSPPLFFFKTPAGTGTLQCLLRRRLLFRNSPAKHNQPHRTPRYAPTNAPPSLSAPLAFPPLRHGRSPGFPHAGMCPADAPQRPWPPCHAKRQPPFRPTAAAAGEEASTPTPIRQQQRLAKPPSPNRAGDGKAAAPADDSCRDCANAAQTPLSVLQTFS